MFICQGLRGKPVDFVFVIYGDCSYAIAWREGLLYDRVHLYTSIVYYCRSSLSLESISSCLFISLIRAGYILMVSSIVAARDNPISLDRVVRSLRNWVLHLMVNVLSFVITFSFKLYVHLFVCTFVMTNLYVHFQCHDISFVCTFLYVQLVLFVITYNISTIWALSTPRPHLFAYKPLCYAIIV